MAKFLKQNGAEPYFESLLPSEVPVLPTGTDTQTIRNNAGTWAATNYLRVGADGAVNTEVTSASTNTNLTIMNRTTNSNFIKCIRSSGSQIFAIDNARAITSSSLVSTGTRVLQATSAGKIQTTSIQIFSIPDALFVSSSYYGMTSPFFETIAGALATNTSRIYIYFGASLFASGATNRHFIGYGNGVTLNSYPYDPRTFDNCIFQDLDIGSTSNVTFNNCTFINCKGIYIDGYFTGTNTFNSPNLSLGAFINNGTLKGTVKSCAQYFVNNGNLSLTLQSINLTTVSIVLGDNSITEINGAKIFVDEVPAFSCGGNVFLTLNNVKIKGTNYASAVYGGTNTTLNANNCIFDAKTASGASVELITYGLWNGVVASGSVTATFSSTNALNANVPNLFDTIKNF